MLAVGCKAGLVWLWRYEVPYQHTPSGRPSPQAFTLVRIPPGFLTLCVTLRPSVECSNRPVMEQYQQ